MLIIFLYPAPLIEMQNDTLEERVTVLEFQVTNLNDEVTLLNNGWIDVGDEIDVIDGEIAVLFADQVIQDERILELESIDEGKGEITREVIIRISVPQFA